MVKYPFGKFSRSKGNKKALFCREDQQGRLILIWAKPNKDRDYSGTPDSRGLPLHEIEEVLLLTARVVCFLLIFFVNVIWGLGAGEYLLKGGHGVFSPEVYSAFVGQSFEGRSFTLNHSHPEKVIKGKKTDAFFNKAASAAESVRILSDYLPSHLLYRPCPFFSALHCLGGSTDVPSRQKLPPFAEHVVSLLNKHGQSFILFHHHTVYVGLLLFNRVP